MGFNASVILNSKQQSIPVDNLGIGSDIIAKYGTVPANTTQLVKEYTFNKSVAIEWLEFSTNNETAVQLEVYINHSKNGASRFGVLLKDGSGSTLITPKSIRENGSSVFEILYDSDGEYKIALRRPIYMPNGGKINLVNVHGSNPYNGSVLGSVREVK
ncbi:hypothetical protein FPV21_07355 [Carnobacterium sp. PL12RED10]|uniref:hypothetical protein n=1 Tax=Carnobacterium sp. PL12RED10 TaxID=2592351 RepID=UPI0011ED5886|nr:hypothetical protein [Carnobacterium sp. PL12RED10]KAF3299318.1 hypothetical protein FPV21_07355 [Carnobacterium sp. PL12RED10]